MRWGWPRGRYNGRRRIIGLTFSVELWVTRPLFYFFMQSRHHGNGAIGLGPVIVRWGALYEERYTR